eukprot:XP_025001102.1 olfactory receptor 14J1-like [Gallus gallus]
MPNSSSISEFLLLALADTRQLQLLHFWLLLGIYLAALLGNGLISTAVACDHRLHTPMYYFLLNLALLDLGCISTTLPKAMANALWHTRDISYAGCAEQVLLFVFFFSAEYYLLTVMSYDRYVAICMPLHYATLLDSRTPQLHHPTATAAQVPFNLHIPYNPFLASEYEIQYEISPLLLLYGLVKKLPSVLSRDLLGALLCCP